MRVFILEFGEY